MARVKSSLFANSLRVLSLFAAICLAKTAWGQVGIGDALDLSPYQDLREIPTEHFVVMFPQELESHGPRVSQAMEEAFDYVSKLLKWVPRHKIRVYLTDNTDTANGATLFPYRNGMVLNLTPPENTSILYYYDDWLRLLTVHELTHYLNVDPTHGFSEALRILFGDVVRLNATWYDWMLEGLAVYVETRFTQAGRGRGTYDRMLTRAAVEESTLGKASFVSIDNMTLSDPHFPGGDRPYLFGYHLMQEIVDDPVNQKRKTTDDGREEVQSSEDLLGWMSYRSANRFPFLINGNLKRITGKSWPTYWDQWIKKRTLSAKEELQRLQKEPWSPQKDLGVLTTEVPSHALSPNGQWLAYSDHSTDDDTELKLLNLQSGQSQSIEEIRLSNGKVFDPTSRYLVYSELTRSGQYSTHYDLKAYDLKEERITTLTKKMRALDPTFSSDGTKVAFVQKIPGGTQLVEAEWKRSKDGTPSLSKPKILWKPPHTYDVVAGPHFDPAGESIVFSWHPQGENQEKILRLHRASGQVQVQIENGHYNRFPTFDPQGVLTFTSDIDGTDQVYQGSATAKLTRISNVSTGVWQPQFSQADAQSFYASVLTSRGWKISKVSKITSQNIQRKVSEVPSIPSESPKRKDLGKIETQDYNPWATLAPRDWRPTLLVEVAGAQIGYTISGWDAAFRDQYSLAGWYDFRPNRFGGSLELATRALGPTLTWSNSAYTPSSSLYYSSSNKLTQFTQRYRTTLSLSQAIKFQFSYFAWALQGIAQRDFTYLTSATTAVRTSPIVPIAAVQTAWSDTRQSSLAITPEQGQRISLLGASYFLPTETRLKIIGTATKYFQTFPHHVLVPSVTYSQVDQLSSTYSSANVIFNGITSSDLASESLDSRHDLDELRIRGYPSAVFTTRSSGITSLDYRFPLFRIYRGLGTGPAFFKDVFGFFYGENGWTLSPVARSLASAGGGVRASAVLLNFLVTVGAEVEHGFQSEHGGKTEFLGVLRIQSVNF